MLFSNKDKIILSAFECEQIKDVPNQTILNIWYFKSEKKNNKTSYQLSANCHVWPKFSLSAYQIHKINYLCTLKHLFSEFNWNHFCQSVWCTKWFYKTTNNTVLPQTENSINMLATPVSLLLKYISFLISITNDITRCNCLCFAVFY